MKRRIQIALGSASLFIAANAAMAASPLGAWNTNTLTNGSYTATAVGGSVTAVTVLQATGTNILQEKITVSGVDYYHTVVAGIGTSGDTPVTSNAAAQMTTESFISAANNSGTMSARGFITYTPTGIGTGTNVDSGSVTTEIARGALIGLGDPTGIRIDQNYATGAAARSAQFTLLSNGTNSVDGKSLRLDVPDVGNHGQTTIRQASGDYVVGSGTILGPDGGVAITYNDGDTIGVTYIQDAFSNVPPTVALPSTNDYVLTTPQLDAMLGVVSYTNSTSGNEQAYTLNNHAGGGSFTAANKAALIAQANSVISGSPDTSGVVVFGTTTPINIFTGSTLAQGDTWWRSDLFGTTPLHYIATPNTSAAFPTVGGGVVLNIGAGLPADIFP